MFVRFLSVLGSEKHYMKHIPPAQPANAVASPGLRRLVWLNIAVQAAFPLAVAFTPVMAGAGEQHFLQQPAPLSSQRTQVYTLGAGETAASVAKKYHLTLEQLRELNQFRTFAHGLNGLRPGDDVDVPVVMRKDKETSLTASSVDASGTAGNNARESAGRDEGDEQEQKVAGYTSQAGSFLAGSAKSDAAASMARGMATGEAGGALQQWLSHFGTARVQLDADKNFSLKNSQFDLLMPLYDQGMTWCSPRAACTGPTAGLRPTSVRACVTSPPHTCWAETCSGTTTFPGTMRVWGPVLSTGVTS